MYEYVPDELAASPPIVVAAHFCNGSASALFGYAGMPALVAAADMYGFIMIFPQTTNANSASSNCWDVGSEASLTRDGGGDTQAIAQMVQHELDTRNADPDRVYVMGVSSGAMLTQAMLAVYPDVFKAGSEFSGVPAGCWASGYSVSSNWSEACAKGMVTMSAEEWGALVREMHPGYSGHRPRIQLWHGTSDTTIDYANQTEAIKEWTNVLGLNATPNSSDMPSGYQVEKWQNACGFTVLEAHTQNGGGHSTPIDADSVISFFGLDQTGPDPEVAACDPTGTGGSGGTTSGTSASTTGSGGDATAGSSSSTTGGTLGTTASGTGGATGGTASSTTSGTSGSGTSNSGGTLGSSSSGPATVAGTGPSASSTTSGAVTGGTSGTGAVSPTDESGDSGCSCKLGADRQARAALAGLPLIAFGMCFSRRARRRRQREAN